jgi:ABC-type antimicrobial peptide transport system permease subunit
MNWGTLAWRGLRFHWRSQLGVLLGATLAVAILVGALAVGDSVRASLRAMALARLGEVRLALAGGSHFFRTALAEAVGQELHAPVAPIILVRGMALSTEGDARAARVQVVGADDRFWALSSGPPAAGGASARRSTTGPGSPEDGGASPAPSPRDPDGVLLNRRLAALLAARVGDEVLLRVEKPSLLSRDAPLSTVADASIALRLSVAGVVADAAFGRFSLAANQIPPLNAFVPLATLQRELGMPGRANTLLVGPGAAAVTVAKANGALWRRWRLADAGLELRELPRRGAMELRTDRVFLDPPAAQAALSALPNAQGVLTYFVNELRVGNHATPYSTVAALQPGPDTAFLPRDLRDDEIVINEWLAADLAARPGDQLRLTYYVVGPMRRLETRTRSFRVRSVVPIRGAAADRDLMPPFPGVAERADCRDWEPGIPVDLDRIRDRDEAYWDAYRGTPKAFVTLRAGQAMWDNRFGNLTAIRYPLAAGGGDAAGMEACIQQALNPASIGLFFTPAREQALAAASQALDFGQLFLGFSVFLIIAALLLAALLFSLAVEQRAEEVGILLAVGLSPRAVRRLFLAEGAALALLASLLGVLFGTLYTGATLHGLATVWRGAVASAELQYHAEPVTLAAGAAAGFLAAILSIWLVTRKQARASARELLAGCPGPPPGQPGKRRMEVPVGGLAILSFLAALALAAAGWAGGPARAAGAFFGAGALLLVAGLAGCRLLLGRLDRMTAAARLTLASLGARNCARRPGRSLAAAALLASASFLVIAVGANRHDPQQDAGRRASGTGGFAFYAETTLPVHQDLNSAEGREAFGLDQGALRGVSVVPMRQREGDEASCLNLNRALAPRILGVDPDALAARNAFVFSSDAGTRRRPWDLLAGAGPDGTIPAIGDVNTVVWSLGKGLGDTVALTDDQGRPLSLRVVGILANSILQGGLIVSEANFVRRFPERSGYQVFLVDAPAAGAREARTELARGLADVGIELVPGPQRLAEFATVENTYLSIFAVLGGLGVLLGSLGLGIVVLRNVLERRGELALLRAIGFRAAALQRLLLGEHLLLLALGLGVGLVAALVAVFPAASTPGARVPFGLLGTLAAALWAGGFAWVWGATALALRGSLLPALRNE